MAVRSRKKCCDDGGRGEEEEGVARELRVASGGRNSSPLSFPTFKFIC